MYAGKTAIVTGGTSGIGLETCRALAAAGARVVLCARSDTQGVAAIKAIRDASTIAGRGGEGPSQGRSTPGTTTAGSSATMHMDIELLIFDMGDLQEIRRAVEGFLSKLDPGRSIDMVICNAGVMALPTLQRTRQGVEQQMGVNFLAHMLLVHLLLPRMMTQKGPSRIVLVSSLAHVLGGVDITDLNWERRRYAPWRAYAQSKTANILHGLKLAELVRGTPIRVFSLHPGNIATGLTRYTTLGSLAFVFFLVARWLPKPLESKTIPEGAATQVYAATAPELEGCADGEFLDGCSVARVRTKEAADKELADQLWIWGMGQLEKAGVLEGASPTQDFIPSHLQQLATGLPPAADNLESLAGRPAELPSKL